MSAASIMEEAVALALHVGKRMQNADLTCATAESCTGGLIGHIFTENPGSSAYFVGGAVVYSYAAKEAVLGVEHHTLATLGAVCPEVAQQMAQGALHRFRVDLAISVTGIAGPNGGSPAKPVGTVYLHLSSAAGAERGAHFVWKGGRSENKLLSARAAFLMIDGYLDEIGK